MKIISYALAAILILAMIWVFFVTPPCQGAYKLQIGGSKYFLFECTGSGDTSDVARQKVIVLSVDHKDKTVGKYFNFDVKNFDSFFKSQTWKEKTLKVRNERTNKIGKAIVWRSANGGSSGDGHGRWDPYARSKPGQWETGDTILLIE